MKKVFLLEVTVQIAIAALVVYPQIILRNRGLSMTVVGAVSAAAQIMTIFFPLLVGAVARRTGKDGKVLAVCVTCAVLAYLPVTLGKSDVFAIICFVLMYGLIGSCNPITDGYLNKAYDGDSARYSHTRSFGTMAYMSVLVITSLFNFPNESENKQIMVLIAFCGLLFAMVSLSVDDIKGVAKEPEKKTKLFQFDNYGKKFYLMMFIVGISKVASVVIERFLPTYMTEVLNVGNDFTLFTAIGAFCEFMAILISSKLLEKKKVNYYGLFIVSLLGFSIRLIIYRFTTTLVPFLIAQTLHAFYFGTYISAVMAFIDENVSKEQYSGATSFYWAIAVNLPQTFGALAGGYVIDTLGYQGLFSIYTMFPITALILGLIFKKKLEPSK